MKYKVCISGSTSSIQSILKHSKVNLLYILSTLKVFHIKIINAVLK